MATIQHTVVFRLKHDVGSVEETGFLNATAKLAEIPGVKNLQCLRQVSAKNDFTFGLSMEFDSQDDYDAYSAHAIHAQFVETRWIPEVETFTEIDYVPWRD
tara:strand:- start:1335 stop:1637 length:303 start_codon:yes stop_codon:yes gene_type:complete